MLPLAERLREWCPACCSALAESGLAVHGAMRVASASSGAAPVAPQTRQPFERAAVARLEPQRPLPVSVGVVRDAGIRVSCSDLAMIRAPGIDPGSLRSAAASTRVLATRARCRADARSRVGLQRSGAGESYSLRLVDFGVGFGLRVHVERRRSGRPGLTNRAGKRRRPRAAQPETNASAAAASTRGRETLTDDLSDRSSSTSRIQDQCEPA